MPSDSLLVAASFSIEQLTIYRTMLSLQLEGSALLIPMVCGALIRRFDSRTKATFHLVLPVVTSKRLKSFNFHQTFMIPLII